MRTPSTDSSLADPTTPDTPKQCSIHHGNWRQENANLDTPETSEESFAQAPPKDPHSFLKSPKIVAKTFNFLRKFPKEKSGSLERKRKSAISVLPPIEAIAKVPNSCSLDSFALDDQSIVHSKDCDKIDKDGSRPRAMSFIPSSPAILIPRRPGHSPAGTPTSAPSSSLGRPPTPTASDLPWREGFCWGSNETHNTPLSSAPSEPQYANLGPDPDYMTVDEIRGAFHRGSGSSGSKGEDGGYLSMGEIRGISTQSTTSPEEHEYMTMDDIQAVLSSEFPNICGHEEDKKQALKHLYPFTRAHHQHVHHHHAISQQQSTCPQKDEESRCTPGHKSAPVSRKTSCCEASEYLTPQEVGRLLRRELSTVRPRGPLPEYHHHHHHHHHPPH